MASVPGPAFLRRLALAVAIGRLALVDAGLLGRASANKEKASAALVEDGGPSDTIAPPEDGWPNLEYFYYMRNNDDFPTGAPFYDPPDYASCAEMEPICASRFTFVARQGFAISPDEWANDYSCLEVVRNPTWFYFQIEEAGDIEMLLEAAIDIDFVVWGPYDSVDQAVSLCAGDLNSSAVVDCSYSNSGTEPITIPAAAAGKVYILLVTNYYSQAQQITLTQGEGPDLGTTNCTVVNATYAPTTMHPTAFSTPNPSMTQSDRPSVRPTTSPTLSPTVLPTASTVLVEVNVTGNITFSETPDVTEGNVEDFVEDFEQNLARAVVDGEGNTTVEVTEVRVDGDIIFSLNHAGSGSGSDGSFDGPQAQRHRILRRRTSGVSWRLRRTAGVSWRANVTEVEEELLTGLQSSLDLEGVSDALEDSEELEQYGAIQVGAVKVEFPEGFDPISETASPTVSRSPTANPTVSPINNPSVSPTPVENDTNCSQVKSKSNKGESKSAKSSSPTPCPVARIKSNKSGKALKKSKTTKIGKRTPQFS